MLTTQEFAELCETTKKTVIYYDKIELLKPAKYHGRNRLYQPKQVLTFQKIVLLKLFGLTLTEVKKYLNRDPLLLDLFIKKQTVLKEQKIKIEKRIIKADEFINNLKTKKLLVVPKIKMVNPYSIYAQETIGRYVDIKSHQINLFNLIGDKKFENVGLTIFKDPVYSPNNANMISGVLIKETNPKTVKEVKIINVPFYKTVYYIHVGPYSYMSYIWQFLNKYIKENNLKIHPTVFCREFYLLGQLYEPNEENYATELQIPIL